MTSVQRSELDKAILRAHLHELVIAGRGTRKSDGARVLAVTSKSERNRLHLVAIVGGRLECDCKARCICAHRGLVHEALAAERAEREELDRLAAHELAADEGYAEWARWLETRGY